MQGASACRPTGFLFHGRAFFPPGMGQVNVAGLDFYDRLTDALLAAGHHAVCHALSLGLSAGAAPVRRVAAPREVPTGLRGMPKSLPTGSQTASGTGSPLMSRRYLSASAIRTAAMRRARGWSSAQVLTIAPQCAAGPRQGRAGNPQPRQSQAHSGVCSVGRVRLPYLQQKPAQDISAAREVFFAAARPLSINNSWWTDPVVLG